ncbi:MAG TPA: protein kinase [Polyangiaceae bacterium]
MRFGQYAVAREIARGGMACVYEGRHPQLGSRVALKVMQPAVATQLMATVRFIREAKAASQIRHQHVVDVFDIGMQDGMPFIVMEFLEGSNLAELLARNGALPLPGIIEIFLPVISAVATAHEVGIIHRDLKPANVMITQRAPHAVHPMVLDFGISKIINEEVEGTVTRSESLVGTVQYMAPELTRGAKFASRASDQYALGIMLYECATGRRPFTGESYYDLMHAIVTTPVTAPSQLQPSLSTEFDAVVLRAMERDPARRFPSVHALGSALLSFADKRAWALWENEFVGRSGEKLNPWTPTPGTEHDLRAPKSRGKPNRTRAPVRSWTGWSRWLMAALSAYAAAMTFLALRGPRMQEAPTLSHSLVPVMTRPVPVSSVARAAEPIPIDAQPPVDVIASPPTAAETRASARPRKPAAPKTQASGAPAGSGSTAAPPVGSSMATPRVLGTNGAPIVE